MANLNLAENCTSQNPDNNKARAEWSLEIDISNGKPWKKESLEYQYGAWRRSLWLPASRDVEDKYTGSWCFSMCESTDGNGDGEEATVVICEPLVPGCTTSQLTCIADEASCWNFDSEYPSEQPKDKRRSRDWEARYQ